MQQQAEYSGAAIAADLAKLGDEIAADTEATLAEMPPSEFKDWDWEKLREAVKEMRRQLDFIEELIDRKAEESVLGETDEERDWESYWN